MRSHGYEILDTPHPPSSPPPPRTSSYLPLFCRCSSSTLWHLILTTSNPPAVKVYLHCILVYFLLILPKIFGHEVIIIDTGNISRENETILPFSQFCRHCWDKHCRGKYFKYFNLVCNTKFQQNEKPFSTEKIKHESKLQDKIFVSIKFCINHSKIKPYSIRNEHAYYMLANSETLF